MALLDKLNDQIKAAIVGHITGVLAQRGECNLTDYIMEQFRFANYAQLNDILARLDAAYDDDNDDFNDDNLTADYPHLAADIAVGTAGKHMYRLVDGNERRYDFTHGDSLDDVFTDYEVYANQRG